MGRQEKTGYERQIEALENQEDYLEGWRKEEVKEEVERFEQLKETWDDPPIIRKRIGVWAYRPIGVPRATVQSKH
jgi:hypothetical protein